MVAGLVDDIISMLGRNADEAASFAHLFGDATKAGEALARLLDNQDFVARLASGHLDDFSSYSQWVRNDAAFDRRTMDALKYLESAPELRQALLRKLELANQRQLIDTFQTQMSTAEAAGTPLTRAQVDELLQQHHIAADSELGEAVGRYLNAHQQRLRASADAGPTRTGVGFDGSGNPRSYDVTGDGNIRPDFSSPDNGPSQLRQTGTTAADTPPADAIGVTVADNAADAGADGSLRTEILGSTGGSSSGAPTPSRGTASSNAGTTSTGSSSTTGATPYTAKSASPTAEDLAAHRQSLIDGGATPEQADAQIARIRQTVEDGPSSNLDDATRRGNGGGDGTDGPDRPRDGGGGDGPDGPGRATGGGGGSAASSTLQQRNAVIRTLRSFYEGIANAFKTWKPFTRGDFTGLRKMDNALRHWDSYVKYRQASNLGLVAAAAKNIAESLSPRRIKGFLGGASENAADALIKNISKNADTYASTLKKQSKKYTEIAEILENGTAVQKQKALENLNTLSANLKGQNLDLQNSIRDLSATTHGIEEAGDAFRRAIQQAEEMDLSKKYMSLLDEITKDQDEQIDLLRAVKRAADELNEFAGSLSGRTADYQKRIEVLYATRKFKDPLQNISEKLALGKKDIALSIVNELSEGLLQNDAVRKALGNRVTEVETAVENMRAALVSNADPQEAFKALNDTIVEIKSLATQAGDGEGLTQKITSARTMLQDGKTDEAIALLKQMAGDATREAEALKNNLPQRMGAVKESLLSAVTKFDTIDHTIMGGQIHGLSQYPRYMWSGYLNPFSNGVISHGTNADEVARFRSAFGKRLFDKELHVRMRFFETAENMMRRKKLTNPDFVFRMEDVAKDRAQKIADMVGLVKANFAGPELDEKLALLEDFITERIRFTTMQYNVTRSGGLSQQFPVAIKSQDDIPESLKNKLLSIYRFQESTANVERIGGSKVNLFYARHPGDRMSDFFNELEMPWLWGRIKALPGYLSGRVYDLEKIAESKEALGSLGASLYKTHFKKTPWFGKEGFVNFRLWTLFTGQRLRRVIGRPVWDTIRAPFRLARHYPIVGYPVMATGTSALAVAAIAYALFPSEVEAAEENLTDALTPLKDDLTNETDPARKAWLTAAKSLSQAFLARLPTFAENKAQIDAQLEALQEEQRTRLFGPNEDAAREALDENIAALSAVKKQMDNLEEDAREHAAALNKLIEQERENNRTIITLRDEIQELEGQLAGYGTGEQKDEWNSDLETKEAALKAALGKIDANNKDSFPAQLAVLQASIPTFDEGMKTIQTQYDAIEFGADANKVKLTTPTAPAPHNPAGTTTPGGGTTTPPPAGANTTRPPATPLPPGNGDATGAGTTVAPTPPNTGGNAPSGNADTGGNTTTNNGTGDSQTRGSTRATSNAPSGSGRTAEEHISEAFGAAMDGLSVDRNDPLSRTVDHTIRGIGGIAKRGFGFLTGTFSRLANPNNENGQTWLGIGGGLLAAVLTQNFVINKLLDSVGIGKIPIIGTLLKIGTFIGMFMVGRKFTHDILLQGKGPHIDPSRINTGRGDSADDGTGDSDSAGAGTSGGGDSSGGGPRVLSGKGVRIQPHTGALPQVIVLADPDDIDEAPYQEIIFELADAASGEYVVQTIKYDDGTTSKHAPTLIGTGVAGKGIHIPREVLEQMKTKDVTFEAVDHYGADGKPGQDNKLDSFKITVDGKELFHAAIPQGTTFEGLTRN